MVDVIVVGARCAGATLATLLARSGAKVLLLDAHGMPSGMPMSTHFIHAPGMAVLDEIGVGDAIRACNPPTRRFRFQVEEHACNLDRTPDRYQYCPRRSTLDPLLLKAAQDAGADVVDHAHVTELVRDGDRVGGVVAETAQGRRTFHAPLVVGADGRHSTVAKLVGAETYLSHEMTRAAYWFYFPEPPGWQQAAPYADWQSYMG
ncbi:MAG TPA: NAD(P)/FAD-dependent oxidoreductase, partial [Nevskiaceae bacterium]|nr:NAD(P)/FAD-dependent oxidoreductase [Nevskiaceae bacterium]